MRTIQTTKKFRRDLKREKRGRFGKEIEHLLREALSLLATDKLLPRRYYDHELSGDWSDHRDCHVAPDLILIYRKPDTETLELVRLGSHSELGL
jgi:mRNA interferase YafQ